MERISIFNYEAFYLDYLEGNLSEADTKMLLQFLEEHPECRMEDEDLVLLDDAAPMTFSGKQNLKQVDEKGAIGLDNVEHFMIADAEGLLDDEKKAELNAIVVENQELEATRSRYKAVYFQPDTSVVFSGKSDLKQRKTLVLWPYLSGAVAAAAVVVVMLMTGSVDGIFSGMEFTTPEFAQSEITNDKDPIAKPNKGTIDPISPVTYAANSNPRTAKTSENGGSIDKAVTNLTKMQRRMEGLAPSKIVGDMAVRPINSNSQSPEMQPDFGGPIVSANPKEKIMENPIEPITAFISEKAKKEVDFKRRKASEKDKGGFLLKIGKFELSRNKH